MISDKTILAPEPARPGIPTRRSTLLALLVLLLGLGLASSLLVAGGKSTKSGPSAIAKDLAELKQTGNNQLLADEEAQAARSARPRASGAGGLLRPAAASGPAVAGATVAQDWPPLPPGVRRDDNSSALFNAKGMNRQPAGAGSATRRDLELEAGSRLAKVLVFDSDAPSLAQSVTPGAELRADLRVAGAGPQPGASVAAAPNAALAAQIEALKAQLSTAPAAPHSEGWLAEYGRAAQPGRGPIRALPAASGRVLRQGKVIPAVLGRQINSDLPGRITAYVSANVYDVEGELLIPMGAALVGQYDAGVRVGQSRLLFAFERLILPDGQSFALPAAAGSDLAGAAGMSGEVNNHFFRIFGSSLLTAVLADRSRQPASVTVLGGTGSVTAAGQLLADAGRTMLERNRSIAPTITVEQGTRINVEVVADMLFPDSFGTRERR
ncbi:MAG: conjugation TrbI-like protein [Ramlibacter sp.]|nr:conjugation TrbI-like protein [Ramlibacter sp.]